MLQDIDLGAAGKKVLIGFIIFLVVYFFLRTCVFCPTSTKHNLREDSTYIINTTCYGAYTKDAMDELVRHLGNNNPASAALLYAKGELVSLKEGTCVNLVKYGLTMCKVDVVSGDSRGATVYVLTEFIK